MTRSATAEAAARLLASPRPYTVTTEDGTLIRTLHCKSHHTHSARLLASLTAAKLGVPVWLCHEGTETFLFDAEGVCTWALS